MSKKAISAEAGPDDRAPTDSRPVQWGDAQLRPAGVTLCWLSLTQLHLDRRGHDLSSTRHERTDTQQHRNRKCTDRKLIQAPLISPFVLYLFSSPILWLTPFQLKLTHSSTICCDGTCALPQGACVDIHSYMFLPVGLW